MQDRDIDDVLDEVATEQYNTGVFDGEIWMSTDGKHTVRGSANTEEGRKQMRLWVERVYNNILLLNGTKQEQAVKAYKKAEEEVKEDGECKHQFAITKVSHTEKNPGRKFSYCPNCKKFLGWV